jgi:hypothetical protein
MQTSVKPLKFLFIATFADGHTIRQTPDDKSAIEPEKRSQFFDVLHYGAKIPLVRFELQGEHSPLGWFTYAVDLVDGHFEVCGVPVRMHEEDLTGFEIIFFRQHSHHIAVGKDEDTEIGHDVVYRLGWKLKGNQNYQRVMQFD